MGACSVGLLTGRTVRPAVGLLACVPGGGGGAGVAALQACGHVDIGTVGSWPSLSLPVTVLCLLVSQPPDQSASW
jgi:hypothetical protein